MLLLETTPLQMHFGQRRVLDTGALRVYAGERIGLIGINGAGKSTLLSILAGELAPDTGSVRRFAPLAYCRQFGAGDPQDGRLRRELGARGLAGDGPLSGGERTRLRLAQALSTGARVLLCDEPTANLDMQGVRVVREKLREAETIILVSHDRALLDALCTHIWLLEEGAVKVYEGNYTAYAAKRRHEIQTQAGQYEAYIAEKRRLEGVYEQKMQKAGRVGNAPRNLDPREAKLRRYLASKPFDVKQKNMQRGAKAVLSRIEHLEKKEKPREPARIELDFSLTEPPVSKTVFRGAGVRFAYGEHVIFENASFTIENGRRTALLGENGAGKTTLLNLLAAGAPGITRAPRVRTGYFRQGFEQLDEGKSILQNVMETSVQPEHVARTILARLLFGREELSKRVCVISGGERIKTAFAKLFVSDANVLLLDEPTNYLDMPAIEAMQGVLAEYAGTVVLVSHDDAFVRAVADRLLIIRDGRIACFEGALSDYEREQEKKRAPGADAALLDMRIAQTLSRLCTEKNPARREQLECAYEALLKQKRGGDG